MKNKSTLSIIVMAILLSSVVLSMCVIMSYVSYMAFMISPKATAIVVGILLTGLLISKRIK